MASVKCWVVLREGKRAGRNDPLIMMMGRRRGDAGKGKRPRR